MAAKKKFLDIAKLVADATSGGFSGGPPVAPRPVLPNIRNLNPEVAASRQVSDIELSRHLKQKRYDAVSSFDNNPQFQEEQYGKNLDWGWVTPDINLAVTATGLKRMQGRGVGLPKNLEQKVLDQVLAVYTSKGYRPVYQEFVDSIQKYGPTGDDGAVVGPSAKRNRGRDAYNAIMKTFLPMEQAGIPREWTGVVSKSLPEEMRPSNPRYVSYVRNVSNVMRDMSNNQRNLFLSQLKDWRGPVDQLAEFVVESVQ